MHPELCIKRKAEEVYKFHFPFYCELGALQGRLVSKFRVRLIEPPQLHEALLAKVASKAIQKRTVQCMYARVREHQGQEE